MTLAILSIIILIFSIVIHEVSHGYAARLLGDKTAEYEGRLTLNPLKHLDPIGSVGLPLFLYIVNASFIIGWAKPVPYNPYNFDFKWRQWGDALVAIAGPLSNIIIAVAFGFLFQLMARSISVDVATAIVLVKLFQTVIITNITLALFNLVPVPPLDGSKILFALIPHQHRDITYKIEQFALPLAFIAMFLIWPFISPLVFKLAELLMGI